jgi:hypothetical protein
MENTRNGNRMKIKKEKGDMRSIRKSWLGGPFLILIPVLAVAGCYHAPIDTSEYAQGPAPLRMPSSAKQGEACGSYEDSLTGGQVFDMYCSYCHNAPSLAERPFSNLQNAATHMRDRANLTGKEYAKLMEFLRRWHDVPSPNPPVEPSPKRLFFSQPIAELRKEAAATGGPAGTPAAAPPAQSEAANTP